jgi:ornithine cyclodeaminase/alanine dehydrogenase-like protein (mu-crystallin family)
MALILNAEAVKRLLPMSDCIEAMVTALAALSSGRAHMPVCESIPQRLS